MSPGSDEPMVDVAVVGAGPAGMAAAVAAAEAGCTVAVVDTYESAGGQYHRQAARRRQAAPSPAGAVGAFLAAVARGDVQHLDATTVWSAEAASADAPFRLHLTSVGRQPRAATALDARSLVVATGAVDRVLPFPGWDLPGVFTAGGAQALLKGQGVLVGRRVVVGGSGPFLLPVAAGLAAGGATVAALAEATGVRSWPRHAPAGARHPRKLAEATGYVRALRRHRVPMRLRRAVVRADGDGCVEQVTLARLDASWSPVPGTEEVLAVDAVCVSYGFVPQVGLPALLGCELRPDPLWGDHVVAVDAAQESSVPGVFAAGETTGVTGAEGAAAEGARAGLAAAVTLGRAAPEAVGRQVRRARRRRERAFAAVLARLFSVREGWTDWLDDDTIVCRCEEVPYARVRQAVDGLRAADLRSVKLTTRCGMGLCQGRMCGEAVAWIVTRLTGCTPLDAPALSTPPLLTPVPLGQLAASLRQRSEAAPHLYDDQP